ncbi:hypothetical protein GGQ80_001553 [Sphingomonas jinjuensis]|uniref:GmrSD restriction endonucleases N-terminal domain-containing protein n=1 Tax=Sphingomonas jinjuensis TaxID=535907 RepID=A0A840FDK0_9SPHN|nr:DUF262 domain-containing protein [Sphingomonas jinjuensis]MBB4153647.1 hypothetical protein [Sphingomonas jinjuensis]
MATNPTDYEDAKFAPLDQQEDEQDIILGDSIHRYDAAISSSDWTTETVVSQLTKGNIFLDPDFQRRDAWNRVRKSQYIESLILGIPTPQIILAERKTRRGSYIVIDGKQRLLSLRQFAARDDDSEFRPFALSGLKLRTDLNGLSYANLTQSLFGDSAPDFENATIRTVVIRAWPTEDFLYEVFLRINSGSVQLSPQELRQALHPGPFTTFLNRFVIESKSIKSMLGLKQPDFRMRDNEIALRYLAFKHFMHLYNGNLKYILDETTRMFNSGWNEICAEVVESLGAMERAINVTQEVFGRNAFKRWNTVYYETRINRAVFDIMAYYFSQPDIANAALMLRSRVEDAYKAVSKDYRFSTSVSGTTKSLESVHYRFSLWAAALEQAIEIPVVSPI